MADSETNNPHPPDEFDNKSPFYELDRRTADCEQLRHERDLLAEALGDLLVALGAVESRPLTGPQLLVATGDVTMHLRQVPENGR